MSYSKQTWVTGDIVTAEKLNHMEDGIANSDYDIIIKLDTRLLNAYNDNLHIVSGSYTSASAKALLELPLSCCVYFCIDDDFIYSITYITTTIFDAYGSRIILNVTDETFASRSIVITEYGISFNDNQGNVTAN